MRLGSNFFSKSGNSSLNKITNNLQCKPQIILVCKNRHAFKPYNHNKDLKEKKCVLFFEVTSAIRFVANNYSIIKTTQSLYFNTTNLQISFTKFSEISRSTAIILIEKRK